MKNIVDKIIETKIDELKESSLSRVWKTTRDHDCGTISACRYATECGDGVKYTKSQNNDRTAKLKAKLLALGYGVTPIAGTYIENFGQPNAVEVKEKSFLVADIKDTGDLRKDLIKLGTEFDQDSITFQEKGGDYFLISSNTCPHGYPGEGVIGKSVKLGKPMFGKDGEFHSKINGRPFVFESIDNSRFSQLTDYSVGEIRSIVSIT